MGDYLMALKKSVVTVPVGKLSMDSEEDPKIHQGLTKVKNGLYKRTGAIEKRTGDETLLSSLDEDKITTFRGMPMAYDEYGKILSDDKFVTLNERAGFMDVEVQGVAHSRRDLHFYCDIAEIEDVYAVTYITNDPDSVGQYSTFIETFDRNTNTRLDSLELITENNDAYMAKVVALPKSTGDILSYYFFDPDDSDYLQNGTIDTTTGAITAPTRVSGNKQINPSLKFSWDLCAIPNTFIGTPYAAVAYREQGSAGVNVITMADGGSTVSYVAVNNIQFNGGAAISVGLNTADDTGYVLVSAELVGGSTTEIYAACGRYFGTFYITGAMMDTYSENPGHSTLEVSAAESVAGERCHVFVNRVRSTSSIPSVRKNILYDSGGGTGAAQYASAVELKYRAQMASKPFHDGTRVVVPMYTRAWGYTPSALNHFLWVSSDSGSTIGKSLLGEFRKDSNYDIYMLPSTTQSVDGKYMTVGTKITVDDNSYDNRDIYQIMRLDATPTTGPLATDSTERYTFLANSCPYMVDGNSLVEQGFIVYPEPFSLQAATDGGSGIANGTYRYKLVYEWTDAHGQLHESSPSPDYGEVTTAGAQNYVIVTAPTLHFTRKESVQIAIYRTVDSGSSTYYRIASTPMTENSDFTIYNDYQIDANITNLKTLYTDSGEVENIQPRAHRVATVWQRRHFHVDREHEDSWIYYSKEFIEGFGPRDTDLFVLECDPAGGRITALANLIDKLIIFKQDRIYVTEGKGYNDTGGGYNFYTPYMVSPSVGCIDQRSIVRVPSGLMFQASDGIWLIDLSLKLTPLGQPVHEFLEDAAVVGTAKDNERHLVQFFSDGYDMAYDWLRNKWSIWSDREAVAATSVDDTAYWVTSDGYLNRDDKTAYTKAQAPTHYPLRLDTGWFSFAGVGGFQRVYKILILAQNIGDHTLNIKIGYDYDPVWDDVQDFDSSTLENFDASKYFGGAGGPDFNDQAYVIKVYPERQKCSALRLMIEDATQVTPNAAFSISAIAFEVGLKVGVKRTEDGRTA